LIYLLYFRYEMSQSVASLLVCSSLSVCVCSFVLSSAHPFVNLSICLSVKQSTWLFVHVSVCVCLDLSVCLSFCLFSNLSVQRDTMTFLWDWWLNKKFELSSSSKFTRICRLKLAAYCCPTQARPHGSTDLSFKSLYCEFKIENFFRRSEGVTYFRRKRFDRLTFGFKDVELFCRNLAFFGQRYILLTPQMIDASFRRLVILSTQPVGWQLPSYW